MKALNNYQCDNQLSIFDIYSHDTLFGKTSPERSVPMVEKISDVSLKKPVKLQTKTPMFLNLKKGKDGLTQDVSWVTDIQLLGDYMTHSSGVSHKEESAYVYLLITGEIQPQRYYLNLSEKPMIPKPSRLSQILETHPNPKYRLSAKACQGILNRATKRGKELPKLLQIALERQAVTPSKLGGGSEIDSHGKRAGKGALVQTELSGTLGVSQDQTLFTGRDESNVTYGLDRASFNQGQNAQFDFTIDKELMPPLVAKGPGAVATQSELCVQEISKE